MNLNPISAGITFLCFFTVWHLNGQTNNLEQNLAVANNSSKLVLQSTASESETKQTQSINETKSTGAAENVGQDVSLDLSTIRLKNKIIPLSNPVYQALDYFETKGELGFLPQAKPYTKRFIIELLVKLSNSDRLNEREKKMVGKYLDDFMEDTNGLTIYKQGSKNTFALAGFSAETSARTGAGDKGTWALSLVAEPYLSGDLGEHITISAGMGLSVERLRSDIFFQSYTRNGQVNFPYESMGYAYLPYQYNFETMWAHVLTSGTEGEGRPIREGLTAGMIYHTEFNGSWLDGAVQFSINNQRRAWGHDQSNLVLSSSARRFPGVELRIQPAKWIRYSYLTGSLFSYANQRSSYMSDVYGYDIGQVQKNFTNHMLEIMPTKWIDVSLGSGNIWSKRFELAYIIPFVSPRLSQIDVGDHDNLSMYLDIATMIPKVGEIWGQFFVDEFSFTETKNLLKMPGNRYAWQLGWKTNLLSGIIPGTTSTLKYTRVTPFVYTHYPDSAFNTFGSRPNDMTYTHDEFNLGFYLPPNSGELNWKLVNVAVPDLVLSLENRLIIHGTNDLASDNVYQIYGDVYRYQMDGPLPDGQYAYPLLNFTKDGIYDWTMESEFKFDWKIRKSGKLNYYRIVGSLGYGKTWWKSNDSQVVTPDSRNLMTGSIGIVVEM